MRYLGWFVNGRKCNMGVFSAIGGGLSNPPEVRTCAILCVKWFCVWCWVRTNLNVEQLSFRIALRTGYLARIA